MLIEMESVEVFAPPVPVLPRSLVAMVIWPAATPLRLPVGVYNNPFNAAFKLAMVPVYVRLDVPLPLPDSPLNVLSAAVPPTTVSDTWIEFPPASGSLTERELPLPLEKTIG